MAVNKVVYGGNVLLDLTSDTVTPETLAEGVTAHDASGERIVGTMSLLNNHDITLGVHTDGLLYIFVDGVATGNGVSFPSQLGDVYGNVDSGNNIVLQGELADGTYSVKYEMEDGKTVNIGNLVLDTNVYYSITKNLTECTISNNATQAIKGKSYSATITANDGYELKSVTVTMGGSAVSVTNGVINIANVTGNIVITAVAEVTGPAYTNQIPISIGTDGKPFVGTNGEKGYKTGYRLSLSGGGETAQDGTEVTGFIPVTKNSVLRIKNIAYENDTVRGVVGYDANFTKITASGVAIASMFVNYGYDDGDGVRRSQTLSSYGTNAAWNDENLKYIRLCSTDINENSIITVDEEIV